MRADMKRIVERKKQERSRLATLPFAEKIVLLEQLRDREAAIIGSRPSTTDPSLTSKAKLVREHRWSLYLKEMDSR